MIGVAVRLLLVATALFFAVKLLHQAAVARRTWAYREAGVDRAEAWWNSTHGGLFDQERQDVPDDVAPFLDVHGPRTALRAPKPAQAQWVWGWLLIALALLLVLSALAQVTSDTL